MNLGKHLAMVLGGQPPQSGQLGLSTGSWLNSHGYAGIPSGKLSHNYGKSPFLMGIHQLYMAIFNSYVTTYQRVTPSISISADNCPSGGTRFFERRVQLRKPMGKCLRRSSTKHPGYPFLSFFWLLDFPIDVHSISYIYTI